RRDWGGDHRAGTVRHAAAGGIARGCEEVSRRDGSVSEAAGQAGGVRASGQADHRESNAEWRGDPAGRRDPDGAALGGGSGAFIPAAISAFLVSRSGGGRFLSSSHSLSSAGCAHYPSAAIRLLAMVISGATVAGLNRPLFCSAPNSLMNA